MPDLQALLLPHLGTIATSACSLAAVVVLWWLSKHFVTWRAYDGRQRKIDTRFTAHEKLLRRHGQQLTAIEGVTKTIADALGRLPQREDLLKLELGLTEMRGNLQEMGATVHGVKALVERQEAQTTLLHEHILKMRK